MTRPYVRVWGVAYTDVLPGDNPTRDIAADTRDRDAVYNDLAIRLSEKDLERFKSLRGMPICLEHDEDVVLGQVKLHQLSEDGHLRVMAHIYTDTDEGREAVKKMRRGDLNGFSVGYHNELIPGTKSVASKSFRELTLTKEPYFDHCRISVHCSKEDQKELASKDSTYKKNSIWIQLSKEEIEPMSEQEQQVQAPPKQGGPEKMEMPRGDAESLLRAADGLQEELEQAKAEAQKRAEAEKAAIEQKTKMQQELEELRRYKAEEEARYAAEKKDEAEDVVATYEEMQGAKFPEEVRQQTIATMCSKDPIKMHNAEIMRKQVYAYKAQKDAAQKHASELEELKKQMQQMKDEQEATVVRLAASKKDIYGMRSKGKEEEAPSSEEGVGVQASRGEVDPEFPYRDNLHMTDILVPKASAAELQLPFFRQTPATTLSVTASKGASGELEHRVKAAPVHKHVKDLPYSQRWRLPVWFSKMVYEKDALLNGEDCVIKTDREEKAPKFSDL